MDTASRGDAQAPPVKPWTRAAIEALFDLPFNDLLMRAQAVHRAHFDPNAVQLSTLMNIKSGGCPEDCAYCPQSARYDTGVAADGLVDSNAVTAAARAAQARGATRFCMGAAWRSPKDRDIDRVVELVAAVRATGMETCATLGMLTRAQAQRLHDAGLDYYNHNLDTSPEYYPQIISTRTYQDRLDTLAHVREAGLRVCCGGIIGMGESEGDRAGLLYALAALPEPPESVPINALIRVRGTPLAELPPVNSLELIRTIAAARIVMPRAWVRLSAGRSHLSDAEQAMCFFAGANSIFYGEELLTTPNPEMDADRVLFERLGLRPTTDTAPG